MISETIQKFKDNLESIPPTNTQIILAGKSAGDKLVKQGAKYLGFGYYDCSNLDFNK